MPIYFKNSGGSGGDGLPIGSFSYFPLASVTPNYITSGIYSKTTYPELSSIPGYTDAGAEINTLNTASSISYTNTVTSNMCAISNANGTKMVFTIDDDTTHYVVDSNTITGLTPVAGNYFTPALDVSDGNYIRFIENITRGTTCYRKGTSSNPEIYELDVDLGTNQPLIDITLFNGGPVTSRRMPNEVPNVVGGNFFGFTPDDRFFCVVIDIALDEIQLLISNQGDYLNGQIIVVETSTTTAADNVSLGVAVSIDSLGNNVYWFAADNSSSGGTDSLWSFNKNGSGALVNETSILDPLLTFPIAVSGNSACDTVMICNSSTSTGTGQTYFQKITMGSMISTVSTAINNTATFLASIRGTNLGWVGVNTGGARVDELSYDNGETWVVENLSGGYASSCFLKAWGVLGIGTNDISDTIVLNNDITQFSTDSFLVPPLPPLMGVTHEARHKALN